MRYDFPGNARELENIIEHAFVLCRGGFIELQHMPIELLNSVGPPNLQVQPGATLDSIVAFHIVDALRRHDGNRKAVASELGIHATTLARKMRAFGIEPPEQDGRSQRKLKKQP
jgi:transcriptional regulator with PAS, ATPase and Fis domain